MYMSAWPFLNQTTSILEREERQKQHYVELLLCHSFDACGTCNRRVQSLPRISHSLLEKASNLPASMDIPSYDFLQSDLSPYNFTA